jgi:hypothetical protein
MTPNSRERIRRGPNLMLWGFFYGESPLRSLLFK